MNEALNTRNWEVPSYTIKKFKQKTKKYCVCVPVINEGIRIREELTKMMTARIPQVADIIICDGGSTDRSLDKDLLKSLGVYTLLVKTGPGKLSAQLRMGYSYSLKQEYEGMVTIDGNDKDNVEAIPHFIDELKKGYDFVQGSRHLPGGKEINTPKIRLLASKYIHVPIISLLSGFKYTDTTNGYRGYSRRLLLHPQVQPFRDIFNTYELLAYLSVKAPQLGFRVKEIPVIRAYPKKGKTPTKISFFQGNFDLLKILAKLFLRHYDVKKN